ncbi:MAG TPA: fibronectin type III domain-containing protein, partial [Blastocatellia bacterium]|nr:fibronectin type III domain-containing protein [Blastocatellia bacterium]
EDKGALQFSDALNLGQAADLSNLRLRYAVRYVNKRGQISTFSNTVSVEPVAAVAMPPTSLSARDEGQDRVVISWSEPEANVDGSRPASIVGYNIYRRAARRENFGRPLNSEPITDSSFTDRGFQYQVDYIYVVRALSQGVEGLIESADSGPLAFKPVDTFAPAAPDPVSIASAGGIISLFWPSSDSRDLVGYNVYRAESADAGEDDWIKLTAQPITTVTYRDDRVAMDRIYYYRVTAVDRFNNESAPSRVVSETANP